MILDRGHRRCDAIIEEERQRAFRLEQEIRRLTDVIIELRKEGFAHVPPPPELEPDPIDDLVAEIMHSAGFGEDDPAWQQNARYVRRELGRGIEKDAIAEDIRTGDDPNLYLD